MAQIIEFAGNHWILCSVFLFLLSMFLAGEIRNKKLGLIKLSPQQAVQLINHDGAFILDIRKKTDFDQGHLKSAMHIPLVDLDGQIKKLEKHKQSPILITCDHGQISPGAGSILRKHGFDKLYTIAGGLNAWKSEHMPVVK